ncbi:hypothetical protein BDDG_12762 [Blastomyces dermatitidis ATCC 18188]|uniref:Uncharacterized protein n=1 Tax=Ajellomyces dermatitidis (strain ATCC 18188 / CBS 674.68) TaxID=653446 RepID=A0A0J9EPX4_AJEDA|nr:hypothetical protein BDDG_12762 [Blastomyces dermatitidis ATCC 18188]
MAAGGAGNEPDADTLTGRTAAAVKEVEEDVTMKAELLRLIDAVSAFNLAFFTVTEAAAAS